MECRFTKFNWKYNSMVNINESLNETGFLSYPGSLIIHRFHTGPRYLQNLWKQFSVSLYMIC